MRERGAGSFLDRTRDYWKLWVKNDVDISRLPEAVQRLYRRSLLIIRTQIDHSGAVIAATDSDIVQFGRDTYTYMWPRDGSIVATALLQAGYAEITRRFFDFCCQLITPEGFLLHKYNPDGSVGSSWHPWLADGKRQLPIQEDETALVVVALWTHFEKFHDVEFVKPLYKPIIKQMADFLLRYREPHTRLPAPSWDLWEERRGIAAFTVGSVWAGLNAAARFTDAFGETAQAEKYRRAAAEIKEGAIRFLFDETSGCFARSINVSREGRDHRRHDARRVDGRPLALRHVRRERSEDRGHDGGDDRAARRSRPTSAAWRATRTITTSRSRKTSPTCPAIRGSSARCRSRTGTRCARRTPPSCRRRSTS